MYILKSIAIAFSLYSKIPMPQFPWEKKEMNDMLCFFPWIGAVIGAAVYIWYLLCQQYSVGRICYLMIGIAIPILITGGFHLDGFMDTMDALHSYQEKDRKLEILKDSHIGAFSVIMLVTWGLFYAGFFSEITNKATILVFCGGFVFSRVLSGISVICFSPAKKDGMLHFFAESSAKRRVFWMLLFQGILCGMWMLWIHTRLGCGVLCTAILVFYYYYKKTEKEFGGVTGDTAGYFVVVCECMMCIVAAILEQFV